MAVAKNLANMRFGSLLVTEFSGSTRNISGQSVRHWECLCDCGGTTIVSTNALTRGNTKSCGCKMVNKARKHGMHLTRQYGIYRDMKQRCDNPDNSSYPRYGGRGIHYCNKWKTFEGFWEDMQEGYSEDLTIERIDVHGGYHKENCVWSTMLTQSHNRRMTSNNTSGVTGVRFYTDRSGSLYVVASSMLNWKGEEKHFSVRRYGLLPAFAMACDHRKQMLQKLNAQGADYSDKHGL